MASQEQIVNNLNFVRRAITTQQNILNAELSLPVSQQDPAKIQRLQTQIETDKKTFASLENQLKNINTTSANSSPSGAAATNSTVNSQFSLQTQLTELDAEIAALEAQIVDAQKKGPSGRTAQLLATSTLERKKAQRARVMKQLKDITVVTPLPTRRPAIGGTRTEPIPSTRVTDTGDEYSRLLNRFPVPNNTNAGLQGATAQTRSEATRLNQGNNQVSKDWRVKLYLAPSSNYLYNDTKNKLLSPLKKTEGIIFPYTPAIQVSYNAHYDPFDVTHSNYKLYAYKNSSVENISISGEFTAQDTEEANYLLAVIHFLRSVTKMFYGQDQTPTRGTPPPICYLDGFGTYQFNKHPLLITSFTYSLPTDVDYIRATPYFTAPAGTPQIDQGTSNFAANPRAEVLQTRITPGGNPPPPDFTKLESSEVPTYVPTKIQIQIAAIAVVSRKDISDNFSLKEYATGNLLQGKTNEKIGAGIW
jgi:hypothetical protein